MRRAGELLKQIEPQQGGDRRSDQRDAADPLVSRKAAAAEAGFSERQAKTATRIATIPEDAFEDMVERGATVDQTNIKVPVPTL
ncbi:MAG: hypothetical protein IOD05_01945 [Rhodobacter sp.]|nr:hypothetical protein [Rhodobacter sp.]MCA3492822.1 hypothetical protein [Rhodobacter sp.]MCA3500470.1 hypothetical protein [Rhodobacter sp.]MCA3502030.1 hypothetical protein [Rhodobacter sp.]MCA3518150.1 hypothetical protein [Rhodobacter sp.]